MFSLNSVFDHLYIFTESYVCLCFDRHSHLEKNMKFIIPHLKNMLICFQMV